MVPFQVTLIPQFIITKWLGVHVLAQVGIDHIGALTLPNAATAVIRSFAATGLAGA